MTGKPVGPSAAHRCADDPELQARVQRLLEQAGGPLEYGRLLDADPVVARCEHCRFGMTHLAVQKADEERERLTRQFSASSISGICRTIAGSKPPAWPPARWPAVEALVEASLEQPTAPAASMLMQTLRDLLLVEREGRAPESTFAQAHAFLRSYLRSRAAPAELAKAALLGDDPALQAAAYFRQALAEEGPAADSEAGLWRAAATELEARRGSAESRAAAMAASPPGIARRRGSAARVAMRFAKAIDHAVANLGSLERAAAELCSDMVARGHPFSTVNVIRFDEGTIEVVAGAGRAAEWVGRVRHPIHPKLPLKFQDIQSHIVMTGQAEVVSPNDERLDEFIKSHFRHSSRRFFVPLLVAYDAEGRVINDQCRWESAGTGASFKLVTPPKTVVRVFGTMEIGLQNGTAPARDEAFVALAEFVTARAFAVYRCTVGRVFDTIVTVIRRMARANSATLHLGQSRPAGVHWYADHCFRSESGRAPSLQSRSDFAEGEVGGTPRAGGLGSKALAARRARTRSGEELRATNPAIYSEGVRSMTAFPMFAGPEVGLLYIHNHREREFDDEELFWVRFLVERAAYGIRDATAFAEERDRRFQLIGQMKTAKALFEAIQDSHVALEWLVAGSMLNLSAADLVFLYRVYPDVSDPLRAGITLGPLHENRHLFPFVERVAAQGTSCFLNQDALARLPVPGRGPRSLTDELGLARGFISVEGIRYLAALPLRDGDETSSVLILAYRRALDLKLWEQRHLELLASTASVALKMRSALHSEIEPSHIAHIIHAFDASLGHA